MYTCTFTLQKSSHIIENALCKKKKRTGRAEQNRCLSFPKTKSKQVPSQMICIMCILQRIPTYMYLSCYSLDTCNVYVLDENKKMLLITKKKRHHHQQQASKSKREYMKQMKHKNQRNEEKIKQRIRRKSKKKDRT